MSTMDTRSRMAKKAVAAATKNGDTKNHPNTKPSRVCVSERAQAQPKKLFSSTLPLMPLLVPLLLFLQKIDAREEKVRINHLHRLHFFL